MPSPRLLEIPTSHGTIQTPVFMPVGTAAAVKAMSVDELEDLGTQVILGNTYHLMLRPGHETIRKLGGLHKFMAWKGPILTDSGGYQVFSLSKTRKIGEEGVEFQSHIDGDRYFLSPEKAIEVQEALGSDIMMVLDECPPYPVSEVEARASMERTVTWAQRSGERVLSLPPPPAVLASLWSGGGPPPVAPPAPHPLLFGIVQGGIYKNLRKECVERLLELNEGTRRTKNEERMTAAFSGFAIGGISVGEPKELMYEIAAETAAMIPDEYPHYAMGIGLPEDIVEMVGFGIDMFDCVVPTRNARNGQLFTTFGEIQIKNSRYKEDPSPIDENCSCPVCKKYSRAYLRHLYLAKEILSSRLNTMHNLHYYLSLMREIRKSIQERTFEEFRKNFKQTHINN